MCMCSIYLLRRICHKDHTDEKVSLFLNDICFVLTQVVSDFVAYLDETAANVEAGQVGGVW